MSKYIEEKKEGAETSHCHMLPALPGVVLGDLNFEMSTRSPNSLSSGFEGFPDGMYEGVETG